MKSYVWNKNRPKGYIVEGYLADECLTFCSSYMEGVETKFNHKPRNYSNVELNQENYLFSKWQVRHFGKREIKTIDEDSTLICDVQLQWGKHFCWIRIIIDKTIET